MKKPRLVDSRLLKPKINNIKEIILIPTEITPYISPIDKIKNIINSIRGAININILLNSFILMCLTFTVLHLYNIYNTRKGELITPIGKIQEDIYSQRVPHQYNNTTEEIILPENMVENTPFSNF